MPSGVKTVQAKRNRNITNKIEKKNEKKVPPAADLVSVAANIYHWLTKPKSK